MTQQVRGVLFDGGPCPPCSKPWPVLVGEVQVGQITSAAYSPRLKRNVGHSMIAREYWSPGQTVTVCSSDGLVRSGSVSALPFD